MLSLTRRGSPCHSLGQSEKFVGPLCTSLLRHHVNVFQHFQLFIVLGSKCRATVSSFRFHGRCWAADLRERINQNVPIVAKVLFALGSSLIDSTKSTLLTSLLIGIQVCKFNDLVLSFRRLMTSSSQQSIVASIVKVVIIVVFDTCDLQFFSSVCLFNDETRSKVSCDCFCSAGCLKTIGTINIGVIIHLGLWPRCFRRSCWLIWWQVLVWPFYWDTLLAWHENFVVLVVVSFVTFIPWLLVSDQNLRTRSLYLYHAIATVVPADLRALLLWRILVLVAALSCCALLFFRLETVYRSLWEITNWRIIPSPDCNITWHSSLLSLARWWCRVARILNQSKFSTDRLDNGRIILLLSSVLSIWEND